MADLTGKTLPNGYPNLVTIGATTDDNPTTGTLENGKGNNLTSVTFDGSVVVNESGGNNDFRVEGDTEANLLFADASTDRVGIGTNSPSVELEVNGTILSNEFKSLETQVSIDTATPTTVLDLTGVSLTDRKAGWIFVRDNSGSTAGAFGQFVNFTTSAAQIPLLFNVQNSSTNSSSLTLSGNEIKFEHTVGSTRTFNVTVMYILNGR